MMPNRITRPEARVLAEEEFVRFADLVASLTPDEWTLPDRLRRCGTSARSRCTSSVRATRRRRSPQFVHQLRRGVPAQQGDRLAPLGRRHERAADPRAVRTCRTTRSSRSSRPWARRR